MHSELITSRLSLLGIAHRAARACWHSKAVATRTCRCLPVLSGAASPRWRLTAGTVLKVLPARQVQHGTQQHCGHWLLYMDHSALDAHTVHCCCSSPAGHKDHANIFASLSVASAQSASAERMVGSGLTIDRTSALPDCDDVASTMQMAAAAVQGHGPCPYLSLVLCMSYPCSIQWAVCCPSAQSSHQPAHHQPWTPPCIPHQQHWGTKSFMALAMRQVQVGS